MKACNGRWRWRCLLGVATVGVFSVAVTLQGQTETKRGEFLKKGTGDVSAPVRTAGQEHQPARIGPGVPANLRVMPSMVTDYRDKTGGGAMRHGGSWVGSGRGVAVVGGGRRGGRSGRSVHRR